MKGGLFILAVVMIAFIMAGLSMAQPALAGCAPCEAARQRNEENPTYTLQAANTLTENIMNGSALETVSSALTRIQGVMNVTGLNNKDIPGIFGSTVAQGIRERIAPAIERYRNMSVYRLNNTGLVEIAKGMRARIRPVEMEHEHIKVNGTSLIVHNVTNPAVQIQLTIQRDGNTVERNMTITRTRDNNRLNLTVHGSTAMTDSEVIYENGTVYISKLGKTIELRTLPDRVRELVREKWQERAEIQELKLEMANEKLKYMVKTRTRKRLLGLFDADVDEQSEVDTETGEIEVKSGPWWGFLAW